MEYEDIIIENDNILANEDVSQNIMPEEFGYTVELNGFSREFVGQKTGPEVGRWIICCNTAEEFKETVWNHAKKYVKREVIVHHDEPPKFSEEVQPQFEAGKFLKVYDKTGKVNRTLISVDEGVLKLWSNPDIPRELHLYIHQYSMAISSKKIWTSVQNALILPTDKDRSGKIIHGF